MGTQKAGLGGALFSQVRLRVLALFFGHTSQAYQLSEAIRLAGSGRGAVQREIERLTRAGLLTVSLSGSRKVYQANRHSPIFDEVHGLILKTVGLLEPLRKSLKAFAPSIDAAFVYGSVAKGEDTAKSDIDLMIIGREIAYSEVFAALHKAEKAIVRPINPNLMSPSEWRQKASEGNPFINKIAQQPKLFVFGTEDELQGIGQSG
jgi:predicted nucleotidyltransferase